MPCPCPHTATEREGGMAEGGREVLGVAWAMLTPRRHPTHVRLLMGGIICFFLITRLLRLIFSCFCYYLCISLHFCFCVVFYNDNKKQEV